MRTQVQIYCPFGRDVSWITQEICEAYAGACLQTKSAAEAMALSLAGNDFMRKQILQSVLDTHPDFLELKAELLDEFGEAHFIKKKSELRLIAELEERLEKETDNDTYAKLHKELRELRGIVTKPSERTQTVNVAIQTNSTVSIDRHNPKEVSRYYHSLMG